ncbi:unnamed protein product, partial [Durusdinium trenchii]
MVVRRWALGAGTLGATVALLSASQRLSLALMEDHRPTPKPQLRVARARLLRARSRVQAEGKANSLSGALRSTELWQLEAPPALEEMSPEAPRARPFEADAVLRTAQAGDVTRAVRWLETLLSRGFLDTDSMDHCFGAIAVSFARQGNAGGALRYVQRIQTAGRRPEAEVFQESILALAEGEDPDPGKTETTLVLLQQMCRAGHAPDLDCCKAILRSLGLRNQDPAAAARWMENEMPKLGVEPDDEAREILVEAFFLQGLRRGAASWLSSLRNGPSMRLLALLRDRLLQSDEVDDLKYWLGRPQLGHLRRSQRLVKKLLKLSTSPQEAEDCLERCLAEGLAADRSCFSQLAAAWLSNGEPSKAAHWLDRVATIGGGGDTDDADSAAVLAEGLKAGAAEASSQASQTVVRLAQSGAATEASQELMEALASRKAVTREAFEALMAQLATAGQAEEASSWFQRMIANGFEPGVKSCCAVVDAWAQRDPEKAQEILEQFEAEGRPLDRFAYTSVLGAFADAGNCERAEALLERADSQGHRGDVAAYNALLKGLVRKRDFEPRVERYLQQMRRARLAPNEITYTTILGTSAERGQEAQVEKWLQ